MLSRHLVVIASAVIALVAVTLAVGAGATEAFDLATLEAAAGLRRRGLDRVVIDLTALGAFVPLVLIGLGAALLLRRTGVAVAPLQLGLGYAGAILGDTLAKALVGRPRPTVVPHLVDVSSLAYPSGHALSSAIVYGTIALLAGRVLDAGARRVAWALALGVIAAVGASRIYLGVHHPTDVVAAWLGAIIWIAIVDGGLAAWARRGRAVAP